MRFRTKVVSVVLLALSFGAMAIGVMPASEASAASAACAGKGYITGRSSDELKIVDLAANSSATTVTTGLNSPIGFVISPDGNYGYLANSGSNEVLKYDLTTNAVVQTYTGFQHPYYLALSPDGQTLAVSNNSGNSISVVTTATGYTANIALNASPFIVGMNHAGTKIYAAGSNTVWVIDVATLSILSTLTVSGEGIGIGVLPDDSKVYIAGGYSDKVQVIDGTTNTLLTQIAIPQEPYWISVSPDGSKVYSVLYGNSTGAVAVISTASDTVTSTISTPDAPQAYLSGVNAEGTDLYVFGYSPGTDQVNLTTGVVSKASWIAPGDPWDFQTCPVAVEPVTPTTTPVVTTTTTAAEAALATTGSQTVLLGASSGMLLGLGLIVRLVARRRLQQR